MSTVDEKVQTEQATCPLHETSPTPLLDAEVQKSGVREALRMLGQTLIAAADDNACTTCSAQAIVRVLNGLTLEYKRKPKPEKWTRDEKKALKKEAKQLSKDLRILNKELKREARDSMRAERKPLFDARVEIKCGS